MLLRIILHHSLKALTYLVNKIGSWCPIWFKVLILFPMKNSMYFKELRMIIPLKEIKCCGWLVIIDKTILGVSIS